MQKIPEKMIQVLQHEGVVSIATQSEGSPHLVNTWNSYVQINKGDHVLIPAGGMRTTQANIGRNNRVLITLGSREVEGFHGPGTGFLLEGTAVFLESGPEFDSIKERFAWARAAVDISIESITQTL